MNATIKKTSVALLAGACLVCAGAGFALRAPQRAYAAESYVAYVNVGADASALENDGLLSLTAKGFEATVPGTVTEGDSLFTSYSKNATYTAASLPSANYEVAIAVVAEAGLEVKVNETAVTVPEDASGNLVLHTTAESATEIAIEVTGKFCGAMIAEAGSDALFGLDFAPGQVIPYGALLEDVLAKPTAYYVNGSSAELEVEYGDITANTGVDLNFTTVEDVNAAIKVSEELTVNVKCNITTMPDDLVYFINCGSFTVDGADPNTADKKYSYNKKIFEYYGEALLNKDADGNYIPDQVSSASTTWGRYTKGTWASPGDSTFPYNSIVWTNTATDLGYYLTGLDAATPYRIWIGTLSHWHARTSDITFNGQTIGTGELVIGAEKGITVVENVKPDATGLINIHMTQRGSQNEPTICFLGVQKMETAVPAVPSDPVGETTVGMEQHDYTFTGATEGAKVQLYNAAKPNQVLFEETIDKEKISGGSYTIDWGTPFSVAQFYVVQVNKGGASRGMLVTITDIENFEAKSVTEGYTTDKVTVSLKAEADSGIASWEYRLGEYGEAHVTTFAERPSKLDVTFDVEENGDYYIVVTSGRNVTYQEVLTVGQIDRERPVILITPSKDGWSSGSYNVTLAVNSVAPVSEYKLLRNGEVKVTAETIPAGIKFTETGEYVVFVRTAAGQSAQAAVRVSDKPTVTQVTKTSTRTGARYTFGKTGDFDIAAVTVFKLTSSGVQRETVVSGNSVELGTRNGAGTYVATVTTTTGETEMFSFTVESGDLRSGGSGDSSAAQLAAGIVVGVGGLLLAGAGIVTTILLLKRRH